MALKDGVLVQLNGVGHVLGDARAIFVAHAQFTLRCRMSMIGGDCEMLRGAYGTLHHAPPIVVANAQHILPLPFIASHQRMVVQLFPERRTRMCAAKV